MEPIRHVAGRAIPFGRKNVDTDVIIPAHWLKTITRDGLGRGAFEALRKDPGNLFDSAEFKGFFISVAPQLSGQPLIGGGFRVVAANLAPRPSLLGIARVFDSRLRDPAIFFIPPARLAHRLSFVLPANMGN